MDVFLLKLSLSFLVGGAWISFSIWISERFGTRLGGIVIGLPSTALVSLLFIAWTQDPSAAVKAAPVMPAISGACALFAAIFGIMSNRGLATAFASAFASWSIIALSLAFLNFNDMAISFVLFIVFFFAAEKIVSSLPHGKLEKRAFSRSDFLTRAVIGGAIVALAVFLGKALGPAWGGVFAMFPAAFTSTLFLLSRKHGVEYAKSVAKGMPKGTVSTTFFALVFYFAVPVFGIATGTLCAYITSIICAYAMHKLSG